MTCEMSTWLAQGGGGAEVGAGVGAGPCGAVGATVGDAVGLDVGSGFELTLLPSGFPFQECRR